MKERDLLSIYSCLVYLFMYSRVRQNFVIHLSAAAAVANALTRSQTLEPQQSSLRAPSTVAEVVKADQVGCDKSAFCFWTGSNHFAI